MKRARFTPSAVVELEDAARRVDRARPGWGDKLNDEVLEALVKIRTGVAVPVGGLRLALRGQVPPVPSGHCPTSERLNG